ncbi:hypothetical protein ABMY26_21380 [Azospirillum sp. HJ39]|uniref:hypothetical protein n=1 Tax=Azospirillum sp. HJ39 TaxID=3159496 RepID=UPI003558B312
MAPITSGPGRAAERLPSFGRLHRMVYVANGDRVGLRTETLDLVERNRAWM